MGSFLLADAIQVALEVEVLSVFLIRDVVGCSGSLCHRQVRFLRLAGDFDLVFVLRMDEISVD